MDAPPLGRVERDELFRLLVEHVKDYAIFMLDTRGHVVSWNDGAERIKGYHAAEIVGRHFSVFYLPDDVRRGRPADVLRAAEVEGRYSEQGWRLRKDGSRFWADITLTAIRTETDGELIGFAKITRDLTENKRTEEERLELLQKERVAREAAEAALARMRAAHEETAQAEEAVRARDEFLSIAAHELRTPLTGAKAAVQLLARRLSGAGPVEPRLANALQIVERQVEKLALLVTQLLETARIEAGRLTLDVAPIDLVAIARDAAATISAVSGRRVDVSGSESAALSGDGLRLEQVITNLIDNAVKHSPAETAIEVSVSCSEQGVELAVRDRGVGVPPDRREHLFERFFQAHTDRSGMGLGLYISRMIVAEHGGTIHADFPPDGGSRFVVSLPIEARVEGPSRLASA